MINPFEVLNQRLERLENLFVNFAEKILSKNQHNKTQNNPGL